MAEKQETSLIDGYEIVNMDKWDRATNGIIMGDGEPKGGVGEEATNADKIAEYDRIGGLIKKDGYKVKTGSFYNFKKRSPRKDPQVMLIFTDIRGNIVEVPAGEPLPIEVRAAQVADEQQKLKKTKKGKKNKDLEEDESEE